ncbi:hypothetical protein AAY52_11530 [Vibrio metoecus]|nr:hypothetical protein AAY52_11530 [Vibrio metoecus]
MRKIALIWGCSFKSTQAEYSGKAHELITRQATQSLGTFTLKSKGNIVWKQPSDVKGTAQVSSKFMKLCAAKRRLTPQTVKSAIH